jgi:hypothetical protein
VSYRQPGIINCPPEQLILTVMAFMDRTPALESRIDVAQTLPAGSLVACAVTGRPEAR